mmetsp:Transcript_14450/g.34849  ORF Transcript_14450/g.34849 Transcript_14450/m.34849 type:complete len:223 (+) Transcript_14450:1331-1999(+)
MPPPPRASPRTRPPLPPPPPPAPPPPRARRLVRRGPSPPRPAAASRPAPGRHWPPAPREPPAAAPAPARSPPGPPAPPARRPRALTQRRGVLRQLHGGSPPRQLSPPRVLQPQWRRRRGRRRAAEFGARFQPRRLPLLRVRLLWRSRTFVQRGRAPGSTIPLRRSCQPQTRRAGTPLQLQGTRAHAPSQLPQRREQPPLPSPRGRRRALRFVSPPPSLRPPW